MQKYDIHSDDPLEMVWAVREKLYEETQDMTPEEFSRHIRKEADKFEKDLKRVRSEHLVEKNKK